jgi:hypothetical protein
LPQVAGHWLHAINGDQIAIQPLGYDGRILDAKARRPLHCSVP